MKVLLLTALFLVSCIDVGDDRVEQDLLVGKASIGDARVEVANGLAGVRKFQDRQLILWGQAPEFKFAIDPGSQTGEWTLEFWNVLSDARLMMGETLLEPDEQAIPTRQVYRIQLAQPAQLKWVAPDSDDASPWTFLAFADVQERIGDVQDIFDRMADFEDARFVIMAGDIANFGGHGEYVRFQDELKALPIPCFTTLGNHDLSGEDHFYHQFFGRGSQSFVFRDMRFTFLDSATATIAAQALLWFKDWLEDGKDESHLVMMHIPPLDPNGFRNGAFASRAEANKLLNLMNKYDVDIAIYGHVHTFTAFTDGDIPSYISGGGGAIPMRFDGIGRHFLSIRTTPSKQHFAVAIERVYPE